MKRQIDALRKCRRILFDCVRMELSPAAWQMISGKRPPRPIWEGPRGTHPLISVIDAALKSAPRDR